MNDEQRDKIIYETHDAVIRIEARLPATEEKLDDVCESHYKLKGRFNILIGILIGSGVIGGSAAGILELIGK